MFDDIKQNNSTKDKSVITDKLKMLEDLMLEFLHNNEIVDNQIITAKDIIKEYVSQDIDDGEIELYEMMANDVSGAINDIDSKFLSDWNRPSFVALVGYADKSNKDKLLNKWLPYFEKKNNLMSDQKKNFLHMKQDLDQYYRENMESA